MSAVLLQIPLELLKSIHEVSKAAIYGWGCIEVKTKVSEEVAP